MQNLKERVQIKLEILYESIMDFLGDSARKPLIFLAAIAVLLTLRSARKNVKSVSARGGLSPSHPSYSASMRAAGGYSPAGAAGRTSFGAAGATSQFGQSSGLGGAAGAGAAGMYGGQQGGASFGQTSRMGASPAGGAMNSFGSSSAMGGAMSAPVGGSATASGMATAPLHDANGQNVAVIDSAAVPWKDYGGLHEFSGQIETLQAFEDYSAVTNVLNTPGMNKVLLVDGGSSTRTAIFDAAAAQTAQRNGWRGIIITGAVRDSHVLASMNMGVKALGTTPVKGNGAAGGNGITGAAPQAQQVGGGGQKGVALNIGGMNINPGLYVYADKDGVLLSQNQLAAAATTNYGTAGGMGMSPGGGLTGGASSFGSTGGVGGSMAGGTGMMGGSSSPYGSTAGGSSPYGGATGAGAAQRSFGGGMQSGGQTGLGGSTTGGISPASRPGVTQTGMRGASSTSPYGSSYGAPKKKRKLNKKSFMVFLVILIWCVYSWSA